MSEKTDNSNQLVTLNICSTDEEYIRYSDLAISISFENFKITTYFVILDRA